MKKIFFFLTVVILASCSKQAPSVALPITIPRNVSSTCDSCSMANQNNRYIALLDIKSSDWEPDGSGGIKKDLVLLYYSLYPWDYGVGNILDVILKNGAGVDQKVILQGSSLDYLGGTFSLNGNEIHFSGAVSLLPATLKLGLEY